MTVRHFEPTEAARLDRLVADWLPELSRAQARRLIDEGRVRLNGSATTKAGQACAPGDHVTIDLPVVPNLDQLAEEVPLDVLFEDESMLLLNKQPGLLVHPVRGQSHVTLVNAIRARYPEVRDIDGGNRPGVVHRLDRDTSGVLAYAKSQAAQAYLQEQWRLRETEKWYLALVAGEILPPAGRIDAPLGADPTDRRRRAVVEDGDRALTEYHLLEQYGAEAALVEVRIYTGRTHQIRVHLQAIGHPVLGDPLYGSAAPAGPDGAPLIARQALHAWRLGLCLASTGEWRQFEAPLPADLRAAVWTLRARHGRAAAVDLGPPPGPGDLPPAPGRDHSDDADPDDDLEAEPA